MVKEEDEDEDAKKKAVELRLKSIDVSEHVNALMMERVTFLKISRKKATVFEGSRSKI